MMLWATAYYGSPSNTSVHTADFQAFDAYGTARRPASSLFFATKDAPTVAVKYMTTTELDDGRIVIVTELTNAPSHIVHVVNPDGTGATQVATFDEYGAGTPLVLSTDTGFEVIYEQYVNTLGPGLNEYELHSRSYTVDSSTGAVSGGGESVLYDMPVNERVNDIAAGRLGADGYLIAWNNASHDAMLTTRVGGVVTTITLPVPYAGAGDATYFITVTEASDGGAYVIFDRAPAPSDPDGTGRLAHAFMVYVDASGTLGDMIDMTDRLGDAYTNNYAPEVVETDDGLIVSWFDSGAVHWISYQDASGYTTVAGGAGADTLDGTAADDRMQGSDGNDLLRDSDGVDRFEGGEGTDTLALMLTGARLVDLDAAYVVAVDGTGPREALIGIENAIGSGDADILIGDGNHNMLKGLGGDDAITGGAGDDTLRGDLGLDTLSGGLGADVVDGGLDSDLLEGNEGRDTVIGRDGNDTLSGGVDTDSLLGGAGDDSLTGDDGDDILNGQSGDDLLEGGVGNDTLKGSFNVDTLNGGDGNDSLDGGSANDVLNGDTGDDEINGVTGNDNLSGGEGLDTLRGGAGIDTMSGGDGADLLSGGDHSDLLFGDGGNDTLQGQNGLDTLNGGTGDDRLIGGARADTFVFASGYGADDITDFADNQDTIQLDRALWGGAALSVQDVLDTYASQTGPHILLDFGTGDTLLIRNVPDAAVLLDDILLV